MLDLAIAKWYNNTIEEHVGTYTEWVMVPTGGQKCEEVKLIQFLLKPCK